MTLTLVRIIMIISGRMLGYAKTMIKMALLIHPIIALPLQLVQEEESAMMDLPQADGKEANYNEGDSSVSFAGNPEEALLQVLGQKNNNVDANLGNMFDALIA